MCVWTKKRGSMNAEVLMATPCPKSLHGKGKKWIARNILQGLYCPQPDSVLLSIFFSLLVKVDSHLSYRYTRHGAGALAPLSACARAALEQSHSSGCICTDELLCEKRLS